MADWRPMTADEKRAAAALGQCRYPVASVPKRFARSVCGQAKSDTPQITDKQAAMMWRQVISYRRQIPEGIVSMARQMASVPA